MAVAARSQGKHKQRIWVNISLDGIKITDEKTGVRDTITVFLVICFQYPDIHKCIFLWLFIFNFSTCRWLNMSMQWIRSPLLLVTSRIIERLDMCVGQRANISSLPLRQLSRFLLAHGPYAIYLFILDIF